MKGEINMKMNLIILLLLCASIASTSGCDNTNVDTIQGDVDMSVNTSGEFKGVVSNLKFDLDSQVGVPTKEFIVDEKLALEIGNAVIKYVYNEDIL